MKAELTFLKLELRRHLNLVLVIAFLLALMPLMHRWATGRWSYWSGEWPHAVAAVFLAVVLPVAGLILGLGSWAEERSGGTLGWLYSRPFSSSKLFALRVAAGLVVLALLGALVILFNGQGWEDLKFLQQEVEIPGTSQSVMGVLGTLGAPLLLALGLFASAVAADRSQAMVIALVALVAFTVVTFVAVAMQGTLEILNLVGRNLLLAIQVVFLIGGSLAFLWAAARAVHQAPADRGRIRRALRVLVPAVAVLSLALVLLARTPFRVDSSEPAAILELADERTLRLLPARGLKGDIVHPVLEEKSAARNLFVPRRQVELQPDGGGVMLTHWKFGWKNAYLSAEGERFDIEVAGLPSASLTSFGWSPDGTHFGWSVKEGDYYTGVAMFDGARQVHWLPFRKPTRHLTSVLWLDAGSFLTFELEEARPGTLGGEGSLRHRLQTFDLAGRRTADPLIIETDFNLQPVVRRWSSWTTPSRQVRMADRWIFRSLGEYPSKLILVDPQTGALEPLPFAQPDSLGFDARGEAVWLSEGQVFRTRGLDESPVAVCSVTRKKQTFVAVREDWVLFARFDETGLRSACNLVTGEARQWEQVWPPVRDVWYGFDEAEGPAVAPAPVASRSAEGAASRIAS